MSQTGTRDGDDNDEAEDNMVDFVEFSECAESERDNRRNIEGQPRRYWSKSPPHGVEPTDSYITWTEQEACKSIFPHLRRSSERPKFPRRSMLSCFLQSLPAKRHRKRHDFFARVFTCLYWHSSTTQYPDLRRMSPPAVSRLEAPIDPWR